MFLRLVRGLLHHGGPILATNSVVLERDKNKSVLVLVRDISG